MQALSEVSGKKLKPVSDPDALPETDEEKAEQEKQAQEAKPVLDFVKETLGDRVKEARVSKILKTAPVCMTADGPMSLEMEKYFSKLEGSSPMGAMKAERVLELNPSSAAYGALKGALEGEDKDRAAKYVEVLYHQALLIAGLPIEDPAAYTELVCSLMNWIELNEPEKSPAVFLLPDFFKPFHRRCSRRMEASTTSKWLWMASPAPSTSWAARASASRWWALWRASAWTGSATMRTYMVLMKSLMVDSMAPKRALISRLPEASHSSTWNSWS